MRTRIGTHTPGGLLRYKVAGAQPNKLYINYGIHYQNY